MPNYKEFKATGIVCNGRQIGPVTFQGTNKREATPSLRHQLSTLLLPGETKFRMSKVEVVTEKVTA